MRVANTTPVSYSNYARSRIVGVLGKLDNLDAEDQKVGLSTKPAQKFGQRHLII